MAWTQSDLKSKMKLVRLVLVCFIALEEALISSARTDFINGKPQMVFSYTFFTSIKKKEKMEQNSITTKKDWIQWLAFQVEKNAF